MNITTRVGSVVLKAPVLTAAGTAGLGDELADYGSLSDLGAVVTKSLASFAWEGNASPRVAPSGEDFLNAVGLTGPGIAHWRQNYLPALRNRKATVVASIWGRTKDEFAQAANDMRGADIAAVEINASCPNLEGRSTMFAHSATMTADLVRATKDVGVPCWVKLSPNTPNLVEIANAAVEAGAEALVLVNTVLGLVIDVEHRKPALGNGGGGLSGPGIFPIALRSIFDVHAALPDVPLIGVGGISSGEDAVAMVMAGASAVEVGTATFANPRAPWKILQEMTTWCEQHGVTSLEEIRGAAHG
jgi:dihydroorotate dehydrogenase (NAD+) catalytic subunit